MTVHTPISADDVRRSYSKWAGHYDFTFALLGRKYIKQIVARVQRDIDVGASPRRVLDVGTGTGLSLPYFRRDIQVTGIDLSNDMLRRARQRVARKNLHHVSNLFEMDAADLKFIDGYFDAVMATFVMSVVPDPKKVLKEIERVTRPGGRVYLFNHFKTDDDDKRLLAMMERKIAPASRKLGFHSDFCRSQLGLNKSKLKVLEESRLGPFDMFTLLTLEKATD